ncbi:hypothetical protein EVG20_g11695 [Dentipellis fragilis]|uniref:Uncharacterized protein n=1 Tax=Dentipellis fragilis TaxID=205917 RepID=A0A4Y9XLT0_9AGAM|nr:hypothetical protein EVG20_g11695 [Dentipellis fragilis]
MFGTRRHDDHREHSTHRRSLFGRKDRDRVAGGYSTSFTRPSHSTSIPSGKALHIYHSPLSDTDTDAAPILPEAALSNPNTTHEGRKHAKRELQSMGRGNEAHVPMMTRVKRAFGIRSTPRRQRETNVDAGVRPHRGFGMGRNRGPGVDTTTRRRERHY